MPVFSQFIAKYKNYGRTRNNKQKKSLGHKHSMPPHRFNLFGYDTIIKWHSFHVVVSCSLCWYWYSSSFHLNAELIWKIQTSNPITCCVMGRMVWRSNPCGHKILCTHPDQPWGPPALVQCMLRLFPGGRVAGVWQPKTPSSDKFKERVQL
jgi:hypothetical protein